MRSMPRLLLDERILRDGRRVATWAEMEGDRLKLVDGDGPLGLLTSTALERVMVRYGRPVDPAILLDGAALEVGEGGRLRRLRYHAPVDAEGRDYLVWERPNAPPLAVLAAHATAALRYLTLRLNADPNPSDA